MNATLVPPSLHHRLRDLLRETEPLGVSVSSLLQLESHQRQFWLQGNRILGVRNHSILLPNDILDPEGFPRSFRESFRTKSFALFGSPGWLSPWEKLFGSPWRWMDYHYMARDPIPLATEIAIPAKLEIHTANAADLDRLWPLQQQYELEEVVFDAADFNERLSRFSFGVALSRENHWYGSVDSEVACKVSTNARGIHWIQIGGVFTSTPWRRHRLAYALLRHVIDHYRQKSLGLCLFVKKSNLAARGLYEKLGFRIVGDYRIVYYNPRR